MAEYISVTAAVSLIALTLGGQLGGRIVVLPSSNAAALELVVSGARAQNPRERIPTLRELRA